ncbi:ScbA/BarX family gamma-butyrolactone biosynthesis protein [Kitasatospora sp. NPDC059146]|uniref:ScbA/BarX family gamma-butyrolactone biosynthesis protein n=1 Tax=Kitasatospora sp. NPDC059146 TaxID=3346741 RepID=UPI00367AB983
MSLLAYFAPTLAPTPTPTPTPAPAPAGGPLGTPPAPIRPAAPAPRLTSTVAKEYVHRACHAEVFITGSEPLGDTAFTVTAQWPRAHTFFSTPDGTRYDPMLAAETVRQAGLYLAHTRYGVPLDHRFLMWNLDYTARARRLSIGETPTDLTIEARLLPRPRRTRSTVDFTFTATVRRGPHLAATGEARFTTVPDSTYRRLRGARPVSSPIPVATEAGSGRPLPPALVGRVRPCDVVLTPTDTPGTWLLTPDLRHPILFDHAGDHIPGMVLLEAARQAANALGAPATIAPTAAATAFHRYAEHDAPTTVTARHTPGEEPDTVTTTVTGHQHGEPVFTTVLTGRPDRG